ncbi:MAG: outer membrane protein assembly factor BamD [Desulfobacterota bacterium]|nr:outer membrane protein assembly factor BamD [Thermodesulfobacteriota bacterium]
MVEILRSRKRVRSQPIAPPIALLFLLLLSLWTGCASQGKDLKTIKGDPELLYRQGLERFNKRDYAAALEIFNQIKSTFPDSPPYTQWAEIKVGDCHFFKKEYVEAIAAYEEFKKTRPTHEDIPYVLFQIGMSYFHQMRSHDRDQTFTKKALANFEYLVANTPPSLFTEKALEKIELCKKQLADHEFYIGSFYFKQGRFQAAASRFEGLLENYPKWVEAEKTLYLLGRCYLELDQWEKARVIFTRLVEEYPKSPHAKEARTFLNQSEERGRLLQKGKAKEAKRKEKIESFSLVKYEEEGRRPLAFERTPVAVSKKETSPPPSKRRTERTVPRGEERELAPPKKEEDGKGTKEALKIDLKPEEERRVAALPPPGLRPEPKETSLPEREAKPGSRELPLEGMGEPIDITSDRVESFSKENRILFKGNVVARQKDVVIYSDSLEALILDGGKGIDKVIAGGNVKIQQGARMASSEKAVFHNRDQKIFLSGDPKMWEGENMVTGEEIVFDLAKNRVEVRGGPGGRGKVRVLPGGEMPIPK